jgi:hypothetical protein
MCGIWRADCGEAASRRRDFERKCLRKPMVGGWMYIQEEEDRSDYAGIGCPGVRSRRGLSCYYRDRRRSMDRQERECKGR